MRYVESDGRNFHQQEETALRWMKTYAQTLFQKLNEAGIEYTVLHDCIEIDCRADPDQIAEVNRILHEAVTAAGFGEIPAFEVDP